MKNNFEKLFRLKQIVYIKICVSYNRKLLVVTNFGTNLIAKNFSSKKTTIEILKLH